MTVLQLATIPADDEPEDMPADPVAAPQSRAPTRVRRRPPQPGTPAGDAPIAPVPLSVTDRNRAVLRMHMAGKTHAEIGQHFGRSVRTIAEWYGAAKKDLAKTFRQNTAEDIAAEIEAKFASSYAQWQNILERAKLRGDLKLEIQALARMDQSHVHRVQALERIGYFDNVTFKPEADREEDSVSRGRREAGMLLDFTKSILAAGTKYEADFPEPDCDGIDPSVSQAEPMY